MLVVAVAAWVLIQLQWGLGLAWDEIEFFRASRWIGSSRLPYRDFWEHHTPLQWFLFAPLARLAANGCGVAAVLTLRWGQLALSAAVLMLLARAMRRLDVPRWATWTVLLLLGCSATFAVYFIEFRIDVFGNLLLLAGLALLSAERWPTLAGMLWALSVLANMRNAPLVVAATLLLACLRLRENRWGWNPRALRVAAGGLLTAGAFAACLVATRSVDAFRRDVITYNLRSDALISGITQKGALELLVAPFLAADAAGMLLVAAGWAGVAMAFRTIRTPSFAHVLAILTLVSALLQFRMGVHYPYHLQTTFLLSAPLAAIALPRIGSPRWAIVVVAMALAANVAGTLPGFGEKLRYQQAVMCSVDAITAPADTVFDGVGYALRREPAYRYWFLPAGVLLLSDRSEIAPFDLPEFLAARPAAIVYTHRTRSWFVRFPRLASYVCSHYLPSYRNLWLPGLSARVGSDHRTMRWLVTRAGRYRIHASERLANHPWFTTPLDYGVYSGPDVELLRVPLGDYDRESPPLRWSVDGKALEGGTRDLVLRAGSVVAVTSETDRAVGIFVVKEGVRDLFVAPAGSFEF